MNLKNYIHILKRQIKMTKTHDKITKASTIIKMKMQNKNVYKNTKIQLQ